MAQDRISVPALAISNVGQDHECGAERHRRAQSFHQAHGILIFYVRDLATGHDDNRTCAKLLAPKPIPHVGVLESVAQPLGPLHANGADDDVPKDHRCEERDPLRQPGLAPGCLQDDQTHWKDPQRPETGSHSGLNETVERAEDGDLHFAVRASRVVYLPDT
jgi:hypothetical protein